MWAVAEGRQVYVTAKAAAVRGGNCGGDAGAGAVIYIRTAASGGQRRLAMDTADGVATDAAALSLLLSLLLLAVAAYYYHRLRATAAAGAGDASPKPSPPVLNGPAAYPVIGALHAMDGHRDQPFRRFTELARQYGPVYAMAMGSVPCVIVNDYPSIKEVLITNGSKFGGRPDFIRYNVLFAGDRNNCEYNLISKRNSGGRVTLVTDARSRV